MKVGMNVVLPTALVAEAALVSRRPRRDDLGVG